MPVFELPSLSLPSGAVSDVRLSGTVYGRPVGTAPCYVLLGGITADDQPLGDGQAEGWWPAMGRALDLAEVTVLAPALAGKGTTWRGLLDGDAPLPPLSAADLADLVEAWLVQVGAPSGCRVIGASLGGIVALALAARHPARVSRLVVVSAGARPDGWGTGLRHLQREFVRGGVATGDVARGMNLARQLGMLTYRGRAELDARFPLSLDAASPIGAYLDHHGRKFAERFSPRAFLLLSDAIDRPAFGTDRAAIRKALASVRARTVVVGVPEDLLFPFRLQKELVEDLGHAGVDASLRTLASVCGHDAFLTDQDALAQILADAGVFDPEAPPALPAEPEPVPEVRVVRLALVGCGVVGTALLDLIADREPAIAERYGVRFEVVGMAVRDVVRDRGARAQGIPRTADALALVRDPLVDVVVEVAGGTDTMANVVRAALEANKPVVTANKALLARDLGPLAALARARRTALVCEAAAAAALPVMRSLARQVDRPRRLLAIVNGTSNFVLTRMEEQVPLADAVRVAQERGFAEADPSADIDGHDAAAKLTLLTYRAFGAWVRPDAFVVRGIRDLVPADFELAGALGHRIRLIASAEETAGGLVLGVEPMALPSWHLLAGVEEEYNAVYVVGDAAGDLAFFGRGAGGPPTATAVLSDLVDVAHGTASSWPAPQHVRTRPSDEVPRRHLLRVDGSAELVRQVDAMLRKSGVEVRSRTTRDSGRQVLAAWLTDAARPAVLDAVAARLLEREPDARVLALGVVS